MRHSIPQKFGYLTLLVTTGIFLFPIFVLAEVQLVQIPHPDLTGLERIVGAQLTNGRLNVKAIAGNPEATNRLKAISYGDLGHLYHAYDFLDAAAAAYYNAAQLQSSTYRWNYCVAFVAQKQGDLNKALTYYKTARAQKVSPNLIYLVNIRIGECYKDLNNLAGAEKAYKISRTVDPEGPTIHARLGELYLAMKEYDKAVNHLSLALTLYPDANKLHYPLAMAYRRLGKKDLAMYHLSQRGIVGIQPPDPLKKKLDGLLRGYRVHILEGKSAFAAERYVEASQSFIRAINEDPNRAAAWINLSATNSKMGRQKEALANLERAIEIEPDNETIHFNLGSLYLHFGKYPKAIEHLENFLTINGEEAPALSKLAQAYSRNQQFQESVEMYKNSLRLDHTQVKTWLGFINMLEALEEYEAALHAAALAVDKLPRNKTILAKLVFTLAASPNKEVRNGNKAVELSLRLNQLQPDYQTTRLVSMSYAEAGKCNEAKVWMERTISMAKESSQSKNVLQVLQRNMDHYANNVPCRIP